MGSPTLAAKELGCANFEELRIKSKKMKSLRKKQADTLEDFLARIEECTANLGKLQDNVGELKLVQAKVLAEPSERERVKHLTKQQNLVRENKGLGSSLQKLIKQEKARNLKLAKNEDKSSELEIRRTQTQAAAQRFFQIWTEYNNTQNEFRENNKKALIRNMKIIDPESNVSEEVEQKLEAGDFTVLSSIIKESQQAKEDLKRLEDRHLEMVKLEKGIMEVHEMFLEISVLVESQGESVNRIEDSINRAAQNAEQGRQQLVEAEKKKKSARKLKFILAGIGAGVALVVLLLLIFAL